MTPHQGSGAGQAIEVNIFCLDSRDDKAAHALPTYRTALRFRPFSPTTP